MKYPVLYIYKHTHDDGQELRHSIRSLDNMTNWNGQIFISGDKPDWLTGVTHIPVSKDGTTIMHDAEERVLAALEDERLPEVFIFMNDDIFCCEKTEVKNYHNATDTRGPIFYRKAKELTLKKLNKYGIDDPLDYDIHTPMIMTKENRKKVSAMIRPSLRGIPMLPRTIYGNLFYTESIPYEDKKTKSDNLKDGVFISTQFFTQELEKLFPKPSRFES